MEKQFESATYRKSRPSAIIYIQHVVGSGIDGVAAFHKIKWNFGAFVSKISPDTQHNWHKSLDGVEVRTHAYPRKQPLAEAVSVGGLKRKSRSRDAVGGAVAHGQRPKFGVMFKATAAVANSGVFEGFAAALGYFGSFKNPNAAVVGFDGYVA